MTDDILEHLRELRRQDGLDDIRRVLEEHPELEFDDRAAMRALLALCHFLLHDGSRALHHLAQVDEAALGDPASLADFALARFVAGDATHALALLERAVAMPGADATVFARLGSIRLAAGQPEAAEGPLLDALLRDPGQPKVLSNLGGLRVRQGRLDEALELYNRALAANPALELAQQQRARVLAQLGRVDELVEEMSAKLEAEPDDPRYHLRLATVQAQAERHAEAAATLEAALDAFPEEREVRLAVTRQRFQQRQWPLAGQALKEWLEQTPDDTDLRLLLNEARIEAGFFEAAATDLEAAAAALADHPRYPLLKARLLEEQARAQEAVAVMEEALQRFPGLVDAHLRLGHLLTSLGRIAEATEHLALAAALSPGALAQLIENRDHQASDAEVAVLEELLGRPLLPGASRAGVGFTLARVFEQRKEWGRAFETVARANALVRADLRYDWHRHRGLTAHTLETFTPELVARLAGLGLASERPIFVTGMPRSGTTLTEQILCSHPQVYGAGELPWVARLTQLMPKVVDGNSYPQAMAHMSERQLKSAAHYYLDKVARQNVGAARVVDKMPHNFDYIGLIALMLPQARIIHLKRDPRDVAVSNFFQNFAAAHGLMGFAFDLRDIGHMLNDHERLMAHWHALFPGRIYELDYQRLVTEPQTTIRELLDHCGLPWDEAVLRFYETQRPVRTASIRQVRHPIYTSSAEKWRRYEQFLGPLEEVLAQGWRPPEAEVPFQAGAVAWAGTRG